MSDSVCVGCTHHTHRLYSLRLEVYFILPFVFAYLSVKATLIKIDYAINLLKLSTGFKSILL